MFIFFTNPALSSFKSNFLPFTLYLVSETDHNRSLKTHVEMPNASVTCPLMNQNTKDT